MMQAYLDDYARIVEGRYHMPSTYAAALKYPISRLDSRTIRRRLKTLMQYRRDIEQIEKVKIYEGNGAEVWIRAKLDAKQPPELLQFVLKLDDNIQPEEWSSERIADYSHFVLEDELMCMHQAPQILCSVTGLHALWPQAHIMLQLAVLHALAGECYGVCDMDIDIFFGGRWLAEMAISYAPPNLVLCYRPIAIEATDGNEDHCSLISWGLLKFGLPELLILNINNAHISDYIELLANVAQRLVDEPGLWYAESPLSYAYTPDGAIDLQLLPWQSVVGSPTLMPGNPEVLLEHMAQQFDRLRPYQAISLSGMQNAAALVILADVHGQIVPLTHLDAAIRAVDAQTMVQPGSEVDRQYLSTQEKLQLLVDFMLHHPPAEEEWRYLLKATCRSPGSQETENLWFEVYDFNDTDVRGYLYNEPRRIHEMSIGVAYILPWENAVDWLVVSESLQLEIRPESAFRLRLYLEDEGVL